MILPMANFPGRRRAYTLLEVVLAVSISVVLLFGLYMALSSQYYLAKAGREILDEANVSRSVLSRFNQDILCQLGPAGASVQAATTSNSSSSSDGSSGASGQSSSGSTTTGSSSTSGSTTAAATIDNSINFNIGVLGDSSRLVLTVSRMPRDLPRTGPGVSDLRRITYWLVPSDNGFGGLARQELIGVTSTQADSMPPDVPDPGSFIIASQVTDFSIEYFDGSTWQTSWDSTALDPTSQLPMGPPAAIAITIKVAQPTTTAAAPGAQASAPVETSYRHVVAIPAANGFASGTAATGMTPMP